MVHEFKIKSKNVDGFDYLVWEPCADYYLIHLNRYLFDNRGDILYILEILQDATVEGYGGNEMYTVMEGGPTILIHDNDPEDPGIRINRSDLIEIFKAWLEINKVNNARGGIREMILQRDEEHISIIVYYEDDSEFRRTFNYKVKE